MEQTAISKQQTAGSRIRDVVCHAFTIRYRLGGCLRTPIWLFVVYYLLIA